MEDIVEFLLEETFFPNNIEAIFMLRVENSNFSHAHVVFKYNKF